MHQDTYTVWVRRKTDWFWNRKDGVIADGFLPNGVSRYLVYADDWREEFFSDTAFRFSPERNRLMATQQKTEEPK